MYVCLCCCPCIVIRINATPTFRAAWIICSKAAAKCVQIFVLLLTFSRRHLLSRRNTWSLGTHCLLCCHLPALCSMRCSFRNTRCVARGDPILPNVAIIIDSISDIEGELAILRATTFAAVQHMFNYLETRVFAAGAPLRLFLDFCNWNPQSSVLHGGAVLLHLFSADRAPNHVPSED